MGESTSPAVRGLSVRLRLLLAWLLVTLTVPRLGRAEQPSGSEPVIRPPRLTESGEIAYPEGAAGEAEVVLELTVTKDGSVGEVKLVRGSEPFARAAMLAARGWRFEPAQRGGRVVAARVRLAVRFHQPTLPSTGAAAAPSAAPAASGAPPTAPRETPLEVLVLGERPEGAPTSLSRTEIREMPGAFGDPFRAIEALPGVTPLVSGAPYYFVRGAPPGNVGYFFDDIRVPLLYHIGLGPGVIHPGLVSRVDFYPGGYPARYGRFAGGIVAGESQAPPPEWHGEANIRLVDSGAILTAPFAGGRGVATAAGRYSYTAAILSLMVPDTKLEYWDYQARVGFDLGRHDRLSVLAFGAFDLLGEIDSSGKERILFGTEFHRVDLRHDHAFSSRTELRTAATLGFDRTRTKYEQRPDVRDWMIAARAMLRHRFGADSWLRAGADVNRDSYEVDFASVTEGSAYFTQQLQRLLPSRVDLAAGVWAETSLGLLPGVTLVPGVRVDWYSSRGQTAVGVDPRVMARLALSRQVRLIHAVGVANQPPSFIIPVSGIALSDLRHGLQRSVQTSAGVESDLPSGFFGSLTVFQNATFNATDALAANELTGGLDYQARSRAHTVGFEVLLRRPLTRRVGGFLSYTLSRSTRSLHGRQLPSTFDRTHVLNLAPYYDFGRGWRGASRLVFYTGIPTDRVAGGSGRTLPFYRLDLRVSKRWPLGTSGAWWGVTAEVLNAMLNREELVTCQRERCSTDRIGPITIPSLGVEAAF